jgi:hypothetical protein
MNIDTAESGKLPWVKFYFDAWENDLALSRCSLAAQGLWMRMLGIMKRGEPYGHLATNGVPISIQELAERIPGQGGQRGCKRVTKLYTELLRYGVASQTKCGIIYSRRLVRDEANRLINRSNGLKGGNPKYKNPVNPPANHPANPPANPDVEVEKGLQHKPLSRNTAVKHQTARENSEKAWLAPESQKRETAPPGTPLEPIDEFKTWVRDQVPNWAKGKAQKAWQVSEDKDALIDIFRVRALFEIQALWRLFTRAGSKAYDHAKGQKFSMREFSRQIEFLINDDDYSDLKRRFLQGQQLEPIGT